MCDLPDEWFVLKAICRWSHGTESVTGMAKNHCAIEIVRIMPVCMSDLGIQLPQCLS